MTRVRLSVFQPVSGYHFGREVAHVQHDFTVEAERPLAWFKQHADDLVSRALPYPVPVYDALMIEEI